MIEAIKVIIIRAKHFIRLHQFHIIIVDEKLFYSSSIKLSRLKCSEFEGISFEASDKGTDIYGFNMAYVISVFAHLEDNIVKILLENMYEHIAKDGIICIFEQIAPIEVGGGVKDGKGEPAVNTKVCLKMQDLN